MKRILSVVLALIMIVSMLPLGVMAAECPVANNVIDITDKEIYKYLSYYANTTDIKISGANVVSATEDGTTVNIVLDSATAPDAEINVEFGIYNSNSRMVTVSGQKGTVSLENGEAQLTVNITAQVTSSKKGTITYTLNFEGGTPPTDPPECIKATDSLSTYGGVPVEINLKDYFKGAKAYYIVGDGETYPLEGNNYTFSSTEIGTHTLVFAASNDIGECPDYATVTIEIVNIRQFFSLYKVHPKIVLKRFCLLHRAVRFSARAARSFRALRLPMRSRTRPGVWAKR